VCFLPTLRALHHRHQGRLRVVAHPSLLALLAWRGIERLSVDGRALADLFARGAPPRPDTVEQLGGCTAVYSWTGAAEPNFAARLRSISEGPVWIHPFRGERRGEHVIDYYARCAGVTPVTDVRDVLAMDGEWLPAWERAHGLEHAQLWVIHPGSGAARKNWRGFDDLCRAGGSRGDQRIVVLRGPAEMAGVAVFSAAGALPVEGLTLPQVAGLLRRSARYIGNDSGVSHLAGAVGVRGVVLFAGTDPAVWAPRAEGLEIIHAPDPCASCGPDVFCTHRLPVERVLAAMRET
jgi:hypothetical protein